MANDEQMISSRNIYESLWRGRDFELSHLWQRSIFLTAFIVLAYTGYGFVVMQICEKIFQDNLDSLGFIYLNILGLIIALAGVVLSVLWIMMGKGSKAWYERYEAAIYKVDRDARFIDSKVQTMEEESMIHGNLPTPNNINDSIWSTDGGNYSPSRINIHLGQFSACIFTIAYLSQSFMFSIITLNKEDNNYECVVWKLFLFLFLIIFVWIVLIYTKLGKSKS